MASEQSLTLDQRLSMRLSAQQLRYVKLLEMTEPELEEAVRREQEENPALESLDPAEDSAPAEDNSSRPYTYSPPHTSPADFPDYDFSPPDHSETLYDALRRQLSERKMPPRIAEAADYIVGSLDSNGYLRRPLRSLVDDMAFGPGIEISEEEAREALDVVRSLEPYGVGASDLRECLRLQLIHLPESVVRDRALRIVDDQFEALSMRHTHRIISALRITPAEAKEAIDLIVSLNPKPGASFSNPADTVSTVIPDLIIDNDGGELTLSVNSRIPDLSVSDTFAEAVRRMETDADRRKARKGQEFVISRFNDARDFIRILRQRQQTLLDVMTAIMKIQKEYFATEDVYRLKPMMIKDIAALTGLDLSVISRATANKYVATPWGVFPLRFFFSDSIGEADEESGINSTEILTNRKIEAEISRIVEEEDKRHPLSDEKIRLMMEERGYDVSRRTVAKYRDRLEIPVARLRKDL